MSQTLDEACMVFAGWLTDQIGHAGSGSAATQLDVDPDGRFFLGRLAPEEAVLRLGLGDRGERLDPCAVGIELRPAGPGPWTLQVEVSCVIWTKDGQCWNKRVVTPVNVDVRVPSVAGSVVEVGANEIAVALDSAAGVAGYRAVIRCEVERGQDDGHVVTVLVVNQSPAEHSVLGDTNLYEVSLRVTASTEPFLLTGAPDTFRYERRVPAYGVNCGVAVADNQLRTMDAPTIERPRPSYWGGDVPQPDLRFSTLASTRNESLRQLEEALVAWGAGSWSDAVLESRATDERWGAATLQAARTSARDFFSEQGRLRNGIKLLNDDAHLAMAFSLMNEAISHSAGSRGYDSWRPFQVGFLLANLASITAPVEEAEIADIVWFATGGGKTETYLGLLVTAAIYDRLRGKHAGITAWSRFPLRMLSLQQTQRFADAMAGAELVRRRHGIPGAPFSVGFFVGDNATPNRITEDPSDGKFDPDDDAQVAAAQVLLVCPFCRASVEMAFNHQYWRLEHRCVGTNCPWSDGALPFYIVDEEIYRYLPTVVVGTLDKAAIVAWQAAMRGFVGPPLGICSVPGHGYCYAVRSTRPHGCLVPGCRGTKQALDFSRDLFPPSFRLQDELHLLKDSLGAVDSHYEAVLDDLQLEMTGRKPKILASSATLAGYESQVDSLYRRVGRVFPTPGPSQGSGFWSVDSSRMARRFVALAPRGVTTDFAIDRIITVLQQSIRDFVARPNELCDELEIDREHVQQLISLYGVTVVYGNTLRDLEAVARSVETQLPFPINTAELTGKTDFELVRSTLHRLEHPEPEFADRVHVVTASAMMSHGVDIDRLNVMIVIGLPLTAAEFIQATARVGRTYPGLVFVVHKIARERDAGVYRSFTQFVGQADRFVEPVAVTRRSRRVLSRTLPGIAMARLLSLHEPKAGHALTKVSRLHEYFDDYEVTAESESAAVQSALHLMEPLDEKARETVEDWMTLFFRNASNPSLANEFATRILPGAEDGPMRSLRDVDEQLTIRD